MVGVQILQDVGADLARQYLCNNVNICCSIRVAIQNNERKLNKCRKGCKTDFLLLAQMLQFFSYRLVFMIDLLIAGEL